MYATISIHEIAVMLMLRKLVWKFKAQASFFYHLKIQLIQAFSSFF